MDIDKLTKTFIADGCKPTEYIVPRSGRTEKLGKVFVTPDTKAYLQFLASKGTSGPSFVVSVIIEELRKQGQLAQVYKAARNRQRRENYHAKYGINNEKNIQS